MKKIILVVILVMGIYPTFKNGKIAVTTASVVVAQRPPGESWIKHFLHSTFGNGCPCPSSGGPGANTSYPDYGGPSQAQETLNNIVKGIKWFLGLGTVGGASDEDGDFDADIDFDLQEVDQGDPEDPDGGDDLRRDCQGVVMGQAYIDSCGICVGGTTGKLPCTQDCYGEWGGRHYLDSCGNCVAYEDQTNHCIRDCNGELGGTAYLDSCQTCVGGSTGKVACLKDCSGQWGGTAEKDSCGECAGGSTQINPCQNDTAKYYIKVTGQNKKYYKNDTIGLPKLQAMAEFTVFRENDTIPLQKLKWKVNDSIIATATTTVQHTQAVEDSFLLKVDTLVGNQPAATLTKNTVKIYRRPIVFFHKKSGYDGEYAFDDSSHRHNQLNQHSDSASWARGIQTKVIEGEDYSVPWFSCFDSTTTNLRISTKYLRSGAKDDPNFRVYFRTTQAEIKLNGQNELSYDYAGLKNLNNINIFASQWNDSSEINKVLGYVYVIDNLGDTIGKLHISCERPLIRHLVVVYVNTGTGYASSTSGSFSKTAILSALNSHGHNQLFRRWAIDHSYDNLDTLNLSTEITQNPQWFNKSDSVIDRIAGWFEDHKGISLNSMSPNDSTFLLNAGTRRHVLFVFNDTLPPTATGTRGANGIAFKGGTVTCLWKKANYHTIAHECGHLLGFNHLFETPYNIAKYSTKNIMDYHLVQFYYADTGEDFPEDTRNMFYFCQWERIEKLDH